MFKEGIIDPVKVVRTALQDAASISGLLVTTEAMIADKPEEKDAGGAPPASFSSGLSAIMASVVTNNPDIEAAS